MDVTLKDGTRKVLELKRSDTLGLAPFLEYELPAFFAPDGYTHGIRVCATSLVQFGNDLAVLIEKYGIKSLHYSVHYKAGNLFERMVARIAYCAVVAIWGADCFDERLVLPAILNEHDDIGYWMGCDPMGQVMPLIGRQNKSNAISVGVLLKPGDSARYIIVRIKFFAASDAPEYIVVVGSLKADFDPSAINNVDF